MASSYEPNSQLPSFMVSPPRPGTRFKTLFKCADQVVPVCTLKEPYLTGTSMESLQTYKQASILVGLDGRIVYVGPHAQLELQTWYAIENIGQVVDCIGKSIVPGFVDAHTHPVWSGDRVHEFALKLAGATYLQIHQQGGGIGFTVEHTRQASEQQLFQDLQARISRMARFGTTFCEAKSGYGLDTGTELKLLRVLTQHNRSSHPVKLSITYLGGHSVPRGQSLAQYTDEILNMQIPAIVHAQSTNQVQVDNIDVFYEKGVFEYEETRLILKRGSELGWTINFHGDELHAMQSGQLGAQVGARAISHLEEVCDSDIDIMANNRIFAVLLPTTAYVLRINPPPARRLIDAGVPVSLGSDFNPNAHCVSMPHVMNLACVLLKMSMNEALVASTINAAASIHQEKDRGSIEPGKFGDLVVIGHCDWRHIVYEIVDPPIFGVYVCGELVSMK